MGRSQTVLVGVALLGVFAGAGCAGGDNDPVTDDGDATGVASADAGSDPSAGSPAADNTGSDDGTLLADFVGDPAAGELVFARCRACHMLEEGQNRTGPSLYQIVGREAGAVEGFNYSDANANSGITWSPEQLFEFLEDPRDVMPGTRMVFAGLPGAQDRADLIAYLEAQ